MVKNLNGSRLFRTGQIARLLGCSPRLVCAWIDSGTLPGYRLPRALGQPEQSSKPGDRRVRHDDLIRFARSRGIPLDLPGMDHRVLLVGCEPALAHHLRELLSGGREAVLVAHTLFEAGIALATTAPDVVVVDCVVGRALACAMARTIAGTAGCAHASLVALVPEDIDDPASGGVDTREMGAAGFHAILRKPFDPALLLSRKEVQ